MFTDGHAVSVRRDLRGILLLDSALQVPVNRTDDVVKLEIPLAEVNKNFKIVISFFYFVFLLISF